MPAITLLSGFARDVAEGLSRSPQKRIPSRYLYDDLGSSLFESITRLPEYGLTRADNRLLKTYAAAIVSPAFKLDAVCELGSGSGKKTQYLLEAAHRINKNLIYSPIDVSSAALDMCTKEIGDLVQVRPICADWLDGLAQVAQSRSSGPLLLLFLGSTIGNLPRNSLVEFLGQISRNLRSGDLFLLGADLVKDVDSMLAAYDDPIGVTAAFNLNLLGRINRELDANFDIRAFAHEVRWNEQERRIEMHLLSGRDQIVSIPGSDMAVSFEAGETIWTESSHKFLEAELIALAQSSGFQSLEMWTDIEWPFSEALWQVKP